MNPKWRLVTAHEEMTYAILQELQAIRELLTPKVEPIVEPEPEVEVELIDMPDEEEVKPNRRKRT